ncbi:MAG: FHA domain-containing protein [Candidatus Nanopelagicales bacterium]
MTCPNCGASVPPEARFCSNCGTPLAGVDATGPLRAVAGLEDTGAHAPVAGEDQSYAVLVVRRGPGEGTAYTLEHPVVKVGRGPDQEVFLDDITVSRQHAEIRSTPAGWVIVDLGSLNGTYLNRQPVTEAQLSSGDEVQIGKYRFRFMSGAPADQ